MLIGLSPSVINDPGDPYWSSVKLLADFDGANGATSFTDYSPVAHSPCYTENGATIVTAVSKFGTGSLRTTGGATTRGIITPPTNLTNFGTGDYTIEMWVRWGGAPSAASEYRLFWPNDHTAGIKRPALYVYSNSITYGYNGVNVLGTGALSWTLNQWYHIADSRVSGTTRIYRDGTQVGTAGDGHSWVNSASAYMIGMNCNAWFDDVRVTNGVGRYSAAFTPPTQPFPKHA